VRGTITFATPILGVAVTTPTLASTALILGAPGTNYTGAGPVDFPSEGGTPGACSLSTGGPDCVAKSGNTLSFRLSVSPHSDDIRVIVAAPPQ